MDVKPLKTVQALPPGTEALPILKCWLIQQYLRHEVRSEEPQKVHKEIEEQPNEWWTKRFSLSCLNIVRDTLKEWLCENRIQIWQISKVRSCAFFDSFNLTSSSLHTTIVPTLPSYRNILESTLRLGFKWPSTMNRMDLLLRTHCSLFPH